MIAAGAIISRPGLRDVNANANRNTCEWQWVRGRQRWRKVLELARGFGFEFSPEEAATHAKMIGAGMVAYQRLDELPEFKLPVKYPRSPGYRPTQDENPYNGWYWRTEIKGAKTGPLKGVSVALKDTICVAGVPMMIGSQVLEGYVPDINATVVTRLLDAGAIIVGKTNAEDYSFAGTGHTCALGPSQNPH
jgi:amidase